MSYGHWLAKAHSALSVGRDLVGDSAAGTHADVVAVVDAR